MVHVLIAALALLSGTAFAAEYWHYTGTTVAVSSVIHVNDAGRICSGKWRGVMPPSRRIAGCINLDTGFIYIQRGLSARLHACILRHELKHAAGFGHAFNDPDPECTKRNEQSEGNT